MTTISNNVLSYVKSAALPFIQNKEEIKKISGLFANYVGFISLIQVFNAFKHGTSISNQVPKATENFLPSFKDTAYKMTLWLSHASLILNGMTVGVGPTIVGAVAKRLFSAKRLDAWCGPNINFAGNARHPRHVVSLIAMGFAVPGMVYSLYTLTKWTWSVVSFKQNKKNAESTLDENRKNYNRFPDNWILTHLVLATVFGRPAFHMGHALARKYFLK